MCTAIRFSDNNGNMYFGRNLDWSVGYGQRIVITGKGYGLDSAFCGKLLSGHAIIGMGIVEEDVPLYFDCGNDAGLAIAGLNFPGYAEYEKAQLPDKTNIAAYEFPLWIAMNFENVDEVEAALRDVAIVAEPINSIMPFGAGAMMRGIPGDCYSTSRFVRAAYLNSHYPKKDTEEDNISRMFHTLGGVAFTEGAAGMHDGQFEKTIYTGGFSSRTNMYYYNTYEDFSIRSVCLNDYME